MKSNTRPAVSDLLEKSKLSKLPSLSSRAKPFAIEPVKFTPPVFSAPQPVAHVTCSGCGGRTDHNNEFQRAVGVCRTCLILHSKVDEAFLTYAKRKAEEQLRKLSGGDTF